MSPLFSVVIPTLDRKDELARCLSSLAKVRCEVSDFEIIVVNDGGSIATRSELGDMVRPRALNLISVQNRGPAGARNAGVAAARGEFVAFLDDDCIVRPDWLERLSEAMLSHPDCLVGGRTANMLNDNLFSETSQAIVDYVYRYYDGSRDGVTFFASNNMAARSQLFREVGGFDESFRTAEDRELCRRWRASGRGFHFAPHVQVMHAHHLTFGTLHSQHFSYGRGALPYWMTGGERGLRLEPPAFYRGMLTYPFKRGDRAPLVRSALILSTQIANAAGFFYEALSGLQGSSRSVVLDRRMRDRFAATARQP